MKNEFVEGQSVSREGYINMDYTRFIYMTIFLLIFLIGCAPKRPVLYPNDQFKQAGETVSKEDIDECMRMAEESGAKEDKGKKIAKNTAGAAVIGGASGAAWGAFFGDAGKRAGAGAAAGASGALAHGAMKSGDPGVIYRGFVERCLREKGYDVIGWK
jgi:hypothetical protein